MPLVVRLEGTDGGAACNCWREAKRPSVADRRPVLPRRRRTRSSHSSEIHIEGSRTKARADSDNQSVYIIIKPTIADELSLPSSLSI